MKLGTVPRAALVLAGSLLSVVAAAQTAQTAQTSAQQGGSQAGSQGGLTIPDEVQFLGRGDPNVRKATAIVNGDVITESDIDHRLGLVVASNNIQIPPDEMQRIRAQILRNLIDETLQIQAAAQRDIEIEQREIDQAYVRVAERAGYNRQTFAPYLRSIGSSERSVRRYITADLAWRRLRQRQIDPYVNVGEEEVQAIIQRMTASRGTREFHVGEIYIEASAENPT
ncbi:MAG TPA: SurA N-terminal domain-containing protein, partial [Allosphingosinicella sp.]